MHEVAVIGAGVIGVSSALDIQEKLGKSVNVTIFSERFSPNTTGDVSAGLWTPYILQDTPIENVMKWSKETYDFALKVWQKGDAEKAGISLQIMSMLVDNPEQQVPEWISLTLGHCILNADQIARINREYKANYCKGVVFTTFILEPAKLLPYLMDKFKKLGGKIVQKRVDNFDDLSQFDLIINCTGMNAKKIMNDEEMQPIRGQIIRVRSPGQFHVITDPESYIIPNMDCVILGGTHQENDYDVKVRASDANIITQRCRQFSPSLESAILIKHMVGLRPGRTSVRFDWEARQIGQNGRQVPIIHSYGHGGSGVTLCIGCATDTTQLVETLLTNKSKL